MIYDPNTTTARGVIENMILELRKERMEMEMEGGAAHPGASFYERRTEIYYKLDILKQALARIPE